jgi:hypothetical protein
MDAIELLDEWGNAEEASVTELGAGSLHSYLRLGI